MILVAVEMLRKRKYSDLISEAEELKSVSPYVDQNKLDAFKSWRTGTNC